MSDLVVNEDKRRIIAFQRRVLLMCWFGYMFSYLGKTNLSIIIPDLIAEFGWSKAQIGVAGTLFFWIYSIGQLLNGFLGDKFNSKYMIAVGLLTSSIINMIMGFNKNYIIFLVLWSLNGAALSVLWGPMVKMIAEWFEPEKSEKTGFTMSFTVIVGYICSWGMIGMIASVSSWRWAFWIPSALIFAFAMLWMAIVIDHPSKKNIVISGHEKRINQEDRRDNTQISLLALMKKEYIWIYGIVGALQGFIKEGISFWGPTIISDTSTLGSTSSSLSTLFALCIPVMGGLGIYLSKEILKFSRNESVCNAILMALGIVASIFLMMNKNSMVGTAIGLGTLSALMFGVNALISTVIPLKFAKYQKVSVVTGFLNFSCYMGATLGGIACGMANDYFGWTGIYGVFVVFCIFGIVISGIRNKKKV